MYILDKICSKNICLNELIMFVKNKRSKSNFNKEGYMEVSYKEDRLESIKNKLDEIECSILSYNQYEEVYKDDIIRENIKEL